MLEAVKEIIEDAGVASFGLDLFIMNLPVDVERGVMLRYPFQGIASNYELPGFHKGEFICVCRATNYLEAEALIKQCIAALQTMSEKQVGGVLFRHIQPMTLPIPFPISEGSLWEFNVRFQTAFNVE